MKNDSFFMEMCIKLAKKGYPSTLSNPLVGSVIVYKNKSMSYIKNKN